MPKYLIRADGAVYPYCATLAASARFKVVDELPAEHLRGIERARARRAEQAIAAQLLRDQQEARQDQRRQKAEHQRRQLAAAPIVDAAAEEAQRQADAFTGKR